MSTSSPAQPQSATRRPWYQRQWAWMRQQATRSRRSLIIFGCLGLLLCGSLCCCSGTLFSVVIARPPALPLGPGGNPTPYPTIPLLPTVTTAPATPWPTPGLLPTVTPTPHPSGK